jgi:predicted amidophosphoribosyltransferase
VSNDNDRADDNCHGCGQFRAFANGLCPRCIEADFDAYCERNPGHE